MNLHYTMSGLDFVYLRNGYRRHDTDYGTGTSIARADDLDRAIALHIILSQVRLRGQEVRFLRGLLDYSQTELANQLGVKRITVARWEGAAKTPIPGPADRIVRLIACDRLFEPGVLIAVMEMLLEITDTQRESLFMTYLPDEGLEEPSLFPDDESGPDGWRTDTKVATG